MIPGRSFEEALNQARIEHDIVYRLRAWKLLPGADNDARYADRERREAADEIERLRAQVAFLQASETSGS